MHNAGKVISPWGVQLHSGGKCGNILLLWSLSHWKSRAGHRCSSDVLPYHPCTQVCLLHRLAEGWSMFPLLPFLPNCWLGGWCHCSSLWWRWRRLPDRRVDLATHLGWYQVHRRGILREFLQASGRILAQFQGPPTTILRGEMQELKLNHHIYWLHFFKEFYAILNKRDQFSLLFFLPNYILKLGTFLTGRTKGKAQSRF